MTAEDTPRTDALCKQFGDMLPAIHFRALERENNILRGLLGPAFAEIDALKPDKERLDWLLTPTGSTVCYGHLRDNFTLTRAAIDAARKEREP